MSNYNGTTINYDASGNPSNWRDGMALGWEGRELVFAAAGSKILNYYYNSDGIRTRKTEKTDAIWYYHDYILDGTKILAEKVTTYLPTPQVVLSDTTYIYLYDENDSPIGIKYNGNYYYFTKNFQGDITGIVNASGTSVVEYAYDAWGNLLSTTGTLATTLGAINIFRYRGYVYDVDTELYYLQSRYYDPDCGRFLNPDDASYLGASGSVLGWNLYSYCENNAVNKTDPIGTQPQWAQVIVRFWKGTWAYKSFLYATQKGWFSNLFWLAGFFRTSDGIYHTRQDCWQQFFGYNDFYDWAFDLGTSMARVKYPFFSGNKEYIFWAWKGDYYNLGAGAELGIYSRLVVRGKSTGHWIAETNMAMTMTMTLKYNGRQIAFYSPYDKQWWITCFNPYYQDVYAGNLTVSITITFSNKTLFNDFYKTYGVGRNKSSRWTFDKNRYKATLVF